MVDYSRFDHIGSDSDSDEAVSIPTPTMAPRPPPVAMVGGGHEKGEASTGGVSPAPPPSAPPPAPTPGDPAPAAGGSIPQPMMMTASKQGKEGRIKFEHEGRTVYEWEQSLEEVNLYIDTPPGLQADSIECKITPKHIRLGVKGNPPFIDEDTGGPVVVEESYWMMDGGELNVNLQKMKKADTWPAALQGRGTKVDPITLEGMQKKIMLERFQAENPGFDFSGADFNGQVPDARTFMGGVKYT